MKNVRSAALSVVALLAAVAAHAALPSQLPAVVDPAQADREVALTATTRYVNVNEGETVRFVGAGKPFAVRFAGNLSSLDLAAVAPAGALAAPVKAYVMPASNGHDE